MSATESPVRGTTDARRAEFEAQRQISDDVIEMMKAVGICRAIGQSIGRAFEGVLRLAGRGLVTLMDWHDVAQERRALRSMSDEMLKDIGISRTDAMREASRRFWDADQRR